MLKRSTPLRALSCALLLLASGLWACVACAHRDPAPVAHVAAPASQPGPQAQGAVSPSLASATAPSPKDQAAGVESKPKLDIAAFMQDHFVITTWARDAVAQGDLAALREPLQELSRYRYAEVAPGGWMSYLSQLQAAAGLTAHAESRHAAALGVATMGRICAECHVHNHVQLAVELRLPSEPEPQTESFSARMFRHQWASARLWEGLTAPSDEAWQRGAAVLAEIASKPPSTQQPLSEAARRMLDEVRELGVRAAQANSLTERADNYARLLSMCADCHASFKKPSGSR